MVDPSPYITIGGQCPGLVTICFYFCAVPTQPLPPGPPAGLPNPNVERNGDNAVVEEPGSNEMTGGEESIPIDAVKLTTHVKSHADTESTPPAPQISKVGQSARAAARAVGTCFAYNICTYVLDY